MKANIGIAVNKSKDPGLEYTRLVCDFLEEKGVNLSCEHDADFFNAEFWIILGGDGTMLHYSYIAAFLKIPMFGINLGTLGFLTDVEKQDGLDAITKILKGRYKKEKRLMIATAFVAGPDKKPYDDKFALNDICVGTAGGLKTFSIYVNKQLLNTIRADGIIVATPTGSTAYNLSAGGPILIPGAQMIVITPVCSHSFNSRPLVIGAKDVVKIEAHQASPVFIDGVNKGELEPNRSLEIKKSVFYTTTITTVQSDLYARLRRKSLL